MRTITIQIGNSDNKLKQSEWAHLVEAARQKIEEIATDVHFFGGSPSWYPWQNVAWVIVCPEVGVDQLKAGLALIRHSFKQDSIAWTEGVTEFI